MSWRAVGSIIIVILVLLMVGPVLAADFVNGTGEWLGTFLRNLGD